ncbi:MAG: hypothetical protein ACE5ID_12615, partial [Acidobacteriota bacterium]
MTPPQLRRLRVHQVLELGPGLREFSLIPLEGPLAYQAGQWLSFQVAQGGQKDKGVWRVYSFCSSPTEADPSSPSEFRILVETQSDEVLEKILAKVKEHG